MLPDDDVGGAWLQHVAMCREASPEWRLHRAAFETLMWRKGRPFGLEYNEVRAKMEFLVEMNKIEPFVSMLGSDLFVNAPQLKVEPTNVVDSTPGRPTDRSLQADALRSLGEDWLKRQRIREVAVDAYRMAIMYGGSALRFGLRDDPPEVLDTLWVEAVPRWEAIWDPLASRELERYRGHCRLRRIDQAREITGDSLDGVDPIPLTDAIIDGLGAPRSRGRGNGRPWHGYVRLIELYDLVDKEQAFYVVTGDGDETTVRRVGDVKPAPWTLGNGMPGVPLIPVILLHPPDKPMDGIPPLRRVIQINTEQNLASSIVINAARRDAARTLVTRPGTFDERAVKSIKAGFDLEIVETASEDYDPKDVVAAFPIPPLASSIGVMFDVLERGWKDVQGSSDLQQGRQQKYVSAREAGLLAAYGERAISDMQAAMFASLADGILLLYAALAAKGSKVRTVVNGESVTLTSKHLGAAWHVGVTDAGTTPATAEARLASFVSLQPQLMVLVNIAAGNPGPDGQPPHPAVQRMAQLQLNWLIRQNGFPEEMTWDALLPFVTAKPAEPTPEQIQAELAAAPPQTNLPPDMPVPGVG